jgi:hypothetical protein
VRVKPNNGFQKSDLQIDDNRVGLKGTNGQVREEFEVSEAFNEDATTTTIFNSCFPAYLRAVVEGVNISVFLYGSSGSGKEHTMDGKGADTGLVTLLSENLFNILEEKRYQNPAF